MTRIRAPCCPVSVYERDMSVRQRTYGIDPDQASRSVERMLAPMNDRINGIHAHKILGTHSRYNRFLDYGDGVAYEVRLEEFRVALGNLK